MAILLRGATLLRQLATKLHKECKKPASSAAAPAAASASAPGAGLCLSSSAAAASSSAAVSGSSSAAAAPTAVLRAAAAAARATSIIPRKALPSIPFCSDQEHALAKWLGMKAPPATYWTLPPVNPSRISALSRDGNPPAACSSLPSIDEGEEPLPEPIDSDDDRLSRCFSSCSSLTPSDRGTGELPPVDPLFAMLWAKVQKEVGEESDDEDDDDDDDDDYYSYTSSQEQRAVQEKCSAFLNLSSDALAREIESMLPSSSVPLSSIEKDESEPVGVEQDLDSSILLKSAPLSIRKKVVETPPVAHPEPKRVLVTYPGGAHRSLHPALEALCLHLNA